MAESASTALVQCTFTLFTHAFMMSTCTKYTWHWLLAYCLGVGCLMVYKLLSCNFRRSTHIRTEFCVPCVYIIQSKFNSWCAIFQHLVRRIPRVRILFTFVAVYLMAVPSICFVQTGRSELLFNNLILHFLPVLDRPPQTTENISDIFPQWMWWIWHFS